LLFLVLPLWFLGFSFTGSGDELPNINDASWGEGNWNKMGFVVDNLIYNVDWIWLC
jgi:hypothetical protein